MPFNNKTILELRFPKPFFSFRYGSHLPESNSSIGTIGKCVEPLVVGQIFIQRSSENVAVADDHLY